MLTPLSFPKTSLKLTRKEGQVFVWCKLRKKSLVLTPEEWVRQHLIDFLILEKNVPEGLIFAEMSITVNNLSRRCDIVVFGKDGNPKLIVECKAPEINLTEKVFHQIAQYNAKLNVDYLMLTNGINHVVCQIERDKKELNFIEFLPDWTEFSK